MTRHTPTDSLLPRGWAWWRLAGAEKDEEQALLLRKVKLLEYTLSKKNNPRRGSIQEDRKKKSSGSSDEEGARKSSAVEIGSVGEAPTNRGGERRSLRRGSNASARPTMDEIKKHQQQRLERKRGKEEGTANEAVINPDKSKGNRRQGHKEPPSARSYVSAAEDRGGRAETPASPTGSTARSMQVSHYLCDVCGEAYPDFDGAAACEEAHAQQARGVRSGQV